MTLLDETFPKYKRGDRIRDIVLAAVINKMEPTTTVDLTPIESRLETMMEDVQLLKTFMRELMADVTDLKGRMTEDLQDEQ